MLRRLLRSSLSALAFAALGLAACTVEPTASPSTPDEEAAATVASPLKIYGQESVLRPCDWADRPANGECHFETPMSVYKNEPGPPCTYDANGEPNARPAIGGETKPVFRHVFWPICKAKRLYWNDGSEVLGGAQAPRAVCWTFDAPRTGTFLIEGEPNLPMVHIEGIYDNVVAGPVRASVEFHETFRSYADVEQRTPGALIIAIQEKRGDKWFDLATKASPMLNGSQAPNETSHLEVEARVAPNTEVRTEVRTASTFVRKNGAFEIWSARLFSPTCVPDMSRPGQCL